MNPDHDEPLRQLFRQQREADAQHVPAFGRVTRAPQPPGFSWLPWATAAAAVVALDVCVSLSRRSAPVNTESWTALSSWQASTDVLLTVVSTPWGSEMTTPSDSWFETSTPTEQKETAL